MRNSLALIWILCSLVLVSPLPAQWAKAYAGGQREEPLSLLLTEEGYFLVSGAVSPASVSVLNDQKPWLMKISPKGMDVERFILESQNPQADDTYEKLEYPSMLQRAGDGGYILAGSIVNNWTEGNFARHYNCAFLMKISPDLEIEWQRVLGDDDSQTQEIFYGLVTTPEGGFVAVGSTSSFGMGSRDAWIVKFDSQGEVVWQKTYGGPEDDEAGLIGQTPEGGFWVVGRTRSFQPEPEELEEQVQPGSLKGARVQEVPEPGRQVTWILRLTAEGAILWQKTYAWGCQDLFHSLILTADEGCILAGETIEEWGEEVLPDSNILLVKLDGSGGLVWQRAFGEEDGERITHMIPKGEDKYLAVGDLKSGDNQDMIVLQITKTGHLDWATAFGAELVSGAVSREQAAAVAWSDEEEILVAGSSELLGAQVDDFLLLRLNQDGLIPNCEYSRVLERFPFRDLEVQVRDTEVEFTAAEVTTTGVSFILTETQLGIIRDVCAAKQNLIRR